MEIDVFYLLRLKDSNYLKRLDNFLLSYLEHKSGTSHCLNIIFKGFSFSRINFIKSYIKNNYNVKFNSESQKDINYDIGSYIVAAKKSKAKYLFFLNSSSLILCDNWLKKFHFGYNSTNMGLIGATGSAEKLDHFWFQTWPNYHIRTNAFFINRELFIKLTENLGSFVSKDSVWKFESGSNSLTKRVSKMGLDVAVLGRDGLLYPYYLWQISNTFKIADQSNLIISDNQTNFYSQASIELKNILANKTWRVNNAFDFVTNLI